MQNTNKNIQDDGSITLIDFSQDDSAELIESVEPVAMLDARPEYQELDAKPDFQAIPAPAMGGLLPADTESVVSAEATISLADKALPALTSQQLTLIKNLLHKIEDHTKQINDIIYPYLNDSKDIKVKISQLSTSPSESVSDAQIVEGVFDGENMIGPDGHQYSVPANYASKSRLVEGDLMKLTITASGAFIYKQIEPIDRRRLTGVLEETETGDYLVMADDRRWHVLAASVSYYKGESGDQVTIVIPKVGLSKWAAIENIVKR